MFGRVLIILRQWYITSSKLNSQLFVFISPALVASIACCFLPYYFPTLPVNQPLLYAQSMQWLKYKYSTFTVNESAVRPQQAFNSGVWCPASTIQCDPYKTQPQLHTPSTTYVEIRWLQ